MSLLLVFGAAPAAGTTVTVAPVSVACTAGTTTVTPGTATRPVPVVALTWTVLAPSRTTTVSVPVSPAAALWQAVAPSPETTVTLAVTPMAVTLSAGAVAVTPGAVTLAVEPSVLAWTGVAPTVVAFVLFTPAAMTWTAVAPALLSSGDPNNLVLPKKAGD